VKGRDLLIISQPTTLATGIHAGFPITVTRNDPDYWPLYVANVSLGTHRDSFGRLYREIREDRGYNYGNYSYMEWFLNRPFHLFPPTNAPRKQQYFSSWIRPVGHEYAHHITKAMTWELENFIANGLTADDVEQAKSKARVLYLSLAETAGRLLEYKLDDAFYGSRPGYLDGYLAALEAVTPAQVNAAIKRHLQVENLKYVIVTNDDWAERLAEDIASGNNAKGKDMAAYNFESKEVNGQTEYVIPEEKRAMLDRDAEWEAYNLGLSADRIRVVPSTQLFETGKFLDD
jgi:zinc protease